MPLLGFTLPAPGEYGIGMVFLPVERFIYRVCGIDAQSEQRWTTYALSLIGFAIGTRNRLPRPNRTCPVERSST